MLHLFTASLILTAHSYKHYNNDLTHILCVSFTQLW